MNTFNLVKTSTHLAPIFRLVILIFTSLACLFPMGRLLEAGSADKSALKRDIFQDPDAEIITPKWGKKVENIVLYPDKYSWCELKDIKQIINYPGCKSKIISNKVCVGQCFSYSIPRTIPETPGDRVLQYCDSCRPLNYTWEKITLDLKDADIPGFVGPSKTMDMLIELIHDCSCQSCYDIPVGAEQEYDEGGFEPYPNDPLYEGNTGESHKSQLVSEPKHEDFDRMPSGLKPLTP